MASSGKQGGPMRVLVVDDEPLARRNLTILLSRDGDIGSIAECSSGAEAIEKILQWKPEIVFLDVQMPRMRRLRCARDVGRRHAACRHFRDGLRRIRAQGL
jgi:chemotaxis response regulator CheB